MLARMSSVELVEWMAFYNLEPFGSDAEFLGHAITAATIANVNTPKGKKRHQPQDFMPKFGKKKQSAGEMLQKAQMFAAAGMGTLGKED